jgi:hypothetical protein
VFARCWWAFTMCGCVLIGIEHYTFKLFAGYVNTRLNRTPLSFHVLVLLNFTPGLF